MHNTDTLTFTLNDFQTSRNFKKKYQNKFKNPINQRIKN